MKAKVIIQNGHSQIVLTPENDFEIDIIEKVYNKKRKYETQTNFDLHNSYGTYSKHEIKIDINEIQEAIRK